MEDGDKSAAVHDAQQHPEVLQLTAESNPYLDFYNEFCATRQYELISVFDPAIKEKARAKMYASLDVSVAMVSQAHARSVLSLLLYVSMAVLALQ